MEKIVLGIGSIFTLLLSAFCFLYAYTNAQLHPTYELGLLISSLTWLYCSIGVLTFSVSGLLGAGYMRTSYGRTVILGIGVSIGYILGQSIFKLFVRVD
jgi:hypothetical protein